MATYCFNFSLMFLPKTSKYAFADWLSFMGHRAGLYEAGSPYQITFKTSGEEVMGMRLLNTSVTPCWDSSLGCSCGDCPSASSCAEPLPPPSNDDVGCSVKIGALKVCPCVHSPLFRECQKQKSRSMLCTLVLSCYMSVDCILVRSSGMSAQDKSFLLATCFGTA